MSTRGKSRQGSRATRGGRQEPQLSAHVGPSVASDLPGSGRTIPAPLAALSRVLSSLALLACLIGGAWGLVRLVGGIVPLPFSQAPVLAAVTLPCTLIWAAHLVATRFGAHARVLHHLVGLAVLACLLGILALGLLERDALAPQLAMARDVLAQESVGSGAGGVGIAASAGVGGGAEGPTDATLLVVLGAALAATVLCLFTYVLSAGWLLGLATLPLLGAYPDLGLSPDASLVCLVALPLAGLVARDLALQRRGRAGAALLVALTCAALCLLAGNAIARGQFAQLSRAPEAVNAWGTELYEAIRTGELTGGGNAQAPAAAGAQTDTQGPGACDAASPTGADGAQAPEGTGAAGANPSDARSVVNRGDLHQDGLPLLDLTLDQQPTTTLYLRQFVGGSYADGVWTSAAAAEGHLAQQEAALLGIEETDVTEALASGAFERARAVTAGEGAASPATLTLRSLSAAIDPTSLAPYASLPVQGAADLAAGDSGEAGAQDASPAAVYAWANLGTYDDLIASGALGAAGGAADAGTAADLWDDYASWASQTYLGVEADTLPRLAQLVADNPQEGLADITAFIQRTLAESATYTTTPGAFPTDVEIAEYLLFDGHRGYCQHFATAATLLYRLYGVPARYVTGYAIPAAAFAETAEGTWHAVASDVRAHAWVEVYTDQLGWVPVEVTPASSTQAAPWADDPANAPEGRAATDQRAGEQAGGAEVPSAAEGADVNASGQAAETPSEAEGASAGEPAEPNEEPGEPLEGATQEIAASTITEPAPASPDASADAGVDASPEQDAAPPAGVGETAGAPAADGALPADLTASAGGDQQPGVITGQAPGAAPDARQVASSAPAAGADGATGTTGEAAREEASGPTADASTAPSVVPSSQQASSRAQDGSSSADADDPATSDGARNPLALRVLGILAGIVALGALLVGGARLVGARRRRIVAARKQLPADALLADMLDALAYAGIARGLTGTEPDAAQILAQAVPALSVADAEYLVAAALRVAFGPASTSESPVPADERCLAAYDRAIDHAYGTLPRRRQLAFTLVHAWR